MLRKINKIKIIIIVYMKYCIAVLTRGYTDIKKYSMLINRNKHILNNLNNKTLDILIFHEGNIYNDQQEYIKKETPELNIIFIDISNKAFKPEKSNIKFKEAIEFKINYRHMCSFWFVDFWNFVQEYDILLRIDEDCFVYFNIDKILLELKNNLFITGRIESEADFVTKGLNNFTIDFIYNHKYDYKKYDTKKPYGPYTNLIGFNLSKLRSYDILKKYIAEIDKNNYIYKYRWGDLPLWGEVIYYIFGIETCKIDKTIKYYHESHRLIVN
jgi:hypothetical protein